MAIKRREKRGRPSYEDVIERLDEEVALLHSTLGGLPRAVEADEILRSIWIDDVHNSTAIEGNTMTRAQVQDLVEHRRASGSLVESVEVEGYARAADWVYRHAADFEGVPVWVVREVHKEVIGLAWQIDPPSTRENPGDWRKGGVRIRSVTVSVPSAISPDLEAWSKSTASLGDRHPIIHAAIHHAWFERIHPYVDGNGRVGRLLLNLMLIQSGYPPAVILATQRARYLQTLKAADSENPLPLAEVIARAVNGAMTRLLIPALAGDAKLVPLAALAAQTPYSADYLRQLVLAGRLKAIREGRLWLSSRAWLKQYVTTRDPRGGRPSEERKPSG
jgi:Fic family protein